MINLNEILEKGRRNSTSSSNSKDNNNDPHTSSAIKICQRFSDEVIKSGISEKLKVTELEIIDGGLILNKEIKVRGNVEPEEENECNYLKDKLTEIISQYMLSGDQSLYSAKNVIDQIWAVEVNKTMTKPYETLEGYDTSGNKRKIIPDDGKVMLIDIWATWCGYCMEPMEENMKLSKELPDVEFYGLSTDKNDQQQTWAGMIRSKKWNQIPQYRNPNAMEIVGIESIPSIMIVDKKGMIKYLGHPKKIDLKQTLLSLCNDQKIQSSNSIKSDLCDKENPNPTWLDNNTDAKITIVNNINNMILENDIQGVKFMVNTKTRFYKGEKRIYTQPIFYGSVWDRDFESLQILGATITDFFALRDIEYACKLLTVNDTDDTEDLKALKNYLNK